MGSRPLRAGFTPDPSAAAADPGMRTDSWEAVRQRYQARQHGDPPDVSSSNAPPRSMDEPPSAMPAAAAHRVRRNAYGDEVLD